MEIDCCTLTDVGRVRVNNEDAVGVDASGRVVVLADGMGGYNAGEVASAMAVEQVLANLGEDLCQQECAGHACKLQDAMQVAVEHANRSIFERANTQPECAGMGTTVVMAVVCDQQLMIGHVGDSRAYLWRNGRLSQLTRDHTLIQDYIQLGFISAQEAAQLGYRSLLTRALGVEDTVLLDVSEHELRPGDVVLLCSDGLTDMLDDTEIIEMLTAGRDSIELQARRLVEEAKANGGLDNVSVALIKIGKTPKKSRIGWRRQEA